MNQGIAGVPFISVVVPTYNNERTLKNTVGDVLAQTYRDYELIIVDDGSTDSTGTMAESFAKEDARVRVIHQPNAGPSAARNRGTREARGRYIAYFDSDDRIEPECLNYLVTALEKSGADMACGLIDRVREDYTMPEGHLEFSLELLDGRETMREMLTGKRLMTGPCCRLVPKDWLLEECFPEGRFYEDLSHTYRINLKVRQLALVGCILYHYVMRGGSTTGRKETTKKQCLDYYQAINLCRQGVLEAYPELEKDATVLTMRECLALYLSIRRCPERDEALKAIESKISEWLKCNWRIAAGNSKAPKELRLRCLLFGLSPWLYEKLYYIGIRLKGKALG